MKTVSHLTDGSVSLYAKHLEAPLISGQCTETSNGNTVMSFLRILIRKLTRNNRLSLVQLNQQCDGT